MCHSAHHNLIGFMVGFDSRYFVQESIVSGFVFTKIEMKENYIYFCIRNDTIFDTILTVIEIPSPSLSSLDSNTFRIGPTPWVFFNMLVSYNNKEKMYPKISLKEKSKRRYNRIHFPLGIVKT